jgi:PST family polysaccharide transporter
MLAALIHRKDRLDEAASTATVATLLGGVALTLVALAASPLIGALFHSAQVGRVAAVSSGLLLIRSLLVVPEALLQRRFSFLRRLVIEPAGVTIFGVAAVALTANGLGVWGLVFAYYISGIGDAILSWALLDWRPRIRSASIAMWRELVRYGRWGVASSALQNASEQISVVLLGRFAGAGQLGQFRYGTRIQSTSQAVVVQSGTYVLFPALARITSDRDRFREACIRSLRSMVMIGFPMGLILVPLGVPAAVIAFGPVWRDAGYAAMALSGVTGTGTLVSFSSAVLKADGRPDILTRIQVVILVAATVFMVALLPLGLVGVCVGLSIGTTIGAIYAIVKAGERLGVGFRPLARQTFPAFSAAVAMVAVLTPLEFLLVHASSHGIAASLALLTGEALLGLAVYLLTLRLVSRDTFSELTALMRQLMRRQGPEMSETTSAEAPGTAGDRGTPTKAPL